MRVLPNDVSPDSRFEILASKGRSIIEALELHCYYRAELRSMQKLYICASNLPRHPIWHNRKFLTLEAKVSEADPALDYALIDGESDREASNYIGLFAR
ncbi:MAG: hypothetical protein JWO08_4162 [Verrucomicrobiaceae bacterium]|nr:hypothetical protein [Verrucomicrobiaceae bacterium]